MENANGKIIENVELYTFVHVIFTLALQVGVVTGAAAPAETSLKLKSGVFAVVVFGASAIVQFVLVPIKATLTCA